MYKDRIWLAIPLMMAATALAGCDAGRRYRDQLAVIEVSADGSLGIDAGVQVTPPDTVEAGRAAHVRIRTYGGGCLVRNQERGGRTFVDVRGRTAVLVPFDRFDLGPRSLSGSTWSCTDQLLWWTRVVRVVFDEPGSAEIRVRGISRDVYPERIIEVTRPLEVISRRSG
ncbi:hypothetical protein [Candidatus Palauibacter sp.]|uniref:hypothetical protein n=1 Tax=Candidatus Palauibacter sp. TaxID=3101350 RepID=UPI003B026995